MKGFRLIAITALDGCNNDFSKNLELGHPYQMYRGYEITYDKYKQEITHAKRGNDDVSPNNFYQLNNGVSLNISAIVGKNGTGKSTLFELLYYLIYVIGTKKESNGRMLITKYSEDLKERGRQLLNDIELLNRYKQIYSKELSAETLDKSDIEFLSKNGIIKDFILDIARKYDFYSSVNQFASDLDLYNAILKHMNNLNVRLLADIRQKEKVYEKSIEETLSVSVLYEKEDNLYEVMYMKGKFQYSCFNPFKVKIENTIQEFDLSNFFYTISVNYSHHSLNSNYLGSWINKLFHKNDAYTIPLVINPMRNKGNFDINKELELSKERLMANAVYDLVQQNGNLIGNKYKVSKFIFTPKDPLIYELGYNEEYLNSLKSRELIQNSVEIDSIPEGIMYWSQAIGYMEKKISRIENNYSFIIENTDPYYLNNLQSFLINDESHITKKVRQVINFLRATYKEENRNFWQHESYRLRTSLTPEKMIKWLELQDIDEKEIPPSDLVEYALPGFFNIDFEFEDPKGNRVQFGKLSSGEQQMILNSNTVLYHLYNLQSIEPVMLPAKNVIKRVNHDTVNIVLDEVELYYHPDMQRKLVDQLVNSLNHLKRYDHIGIKHINVCILTHSPFILSDIPFENVLRLTQENESAIDRSKTFGANIHEMLMDNFFMETTIGEFATKEIKEFISFYNEVQNADLVQIEMLKIEYEYVKRDRYNYLISSIGEDVIRQMLSNQLELLEYKLLSKDELISKKNDLEGQLKKVISQIENKDPYAED